MRTVAASCIHEAFLLASPMEDIKKLQMTLLELLDDDNKEIILALVPNIKVLIERFCNDHSLSLHPDPVQPGEANDTTPTKNYMLHSANTFGTNFGGGLNRKYGDLPGTTGNKGFKKLTSLNVGAAQDQPEEGNSAGDPSYIITPEYKSEIVYQELLPKLLAFDEHLHAQIGLWR